MFIKLKKRDEGFASESCNYAKNHHRNVFLENNSIKALLKLPRKRFSTT